MSNYINTIIGVCLAVILLVIGPLTFTSASQQSTAKRLIHNDTNVFLDTVKDKAFITGRDIEDFSLNINSHGMVLDVNVKVYVLASGKDINGNPIPIKTIKYNDLDVLDKGETRLLNSGDLVTVEISEVGISSWRRLSYKILNLDTGKFTYTMAKVVQ